MFEAIAQEHPWPDMSEVVKTPRTPFAIDGGGRDMLVDFIREQQCETMLEVGSFLCGSTRYWLENCPGLKIIAVDVWNQVIPGVIKRYRSDYPQWLKTCTSRENLDQIAEKLERFEVEAVALQEVEEFRDRVVPIKGDLFEVYDYLQKKRFQPDIVYLDAGKERAEFEGAHRAFPNSILSGDDWSWKDSDGRYVVREHVDAIARLRKASYTAKYATWIINP